jgi:Tfp pilus assembly protein PilO
MRGRRAPLFAGVGVVLLIVGLLMLFVLPKMAKVTEARDKLDAAEVEHQTLLVRKEALEQAEANAPAARKTIEEVHRRIPPLADEPGLLLLLENAAEGAGLEVATFGVGNPTFDAASGLSVITVTLAGEGTYFEMADFMYSIETLPRAAKVTAASWSTADASGTVPTLSMSGTMELYTSDSSSGSGSVPGNQPLPPTGEGV